MVIATVVPGLAALAIPVLMVLCARGTVHRNPLLGIRIPTLLASDEAWAIGHRAAVLPMTVSGALALGGAVLALTGPGLTSLGPLFTLGPVLAGLAWATVAATRAAAHIGRSSDQTGPR